jgi:thiamine-phosphate pyrophosphorylase
MTPAAGGKTKPPFPRLIAITDLERAGAPEMLARFERLASAARPGSVMLQLRDRARSATERLGLGTEMAAICTRTGQLLQVNDRLDLVVLLGADAVHLGEASVDTTDARGIVGETVLVTRACHDVARVAEIDADGIVLSPILAPRKGSLALGLPALQRARDRLNEVGKLETRLVALGGVDAAAAVECLAAGADAVAVIGAWLTDAGVEELLDGVELVDSQ